MIGEKGKRGNESVRRGILWGADVFVPSYAAMAGGPYQSSSDRDGGQGGKEGMNTIDERVGRRCIGDG